MKKLLLCLCMIMVLTFSACTDHGGSNIPGSSGSAVPSSESGDDKEQGPAFEVRNAYQVNPAAMEDKTKDTFQDPGKGGTINVTLADDASQVQGRGVVITGNTVLINETGSYMLSGTLSNGNVIIDVAKTDDVVLYLNGVNITSKSTAPLFVRSADKVVISLMPGSENTLTDTMASTNGSTAITAALFSKEDLVINGTGKLVVNGTVNDGITSKDDLKIMEGAIEVHAKDDGIVGKDSVIVKGGAVTVEADGDGLKSTGEEAGKGFIYIAGGDHEVRAGKDGVDAATSIRMSAGTLKVTAGGGAGAAASGSGYDYSNWGSGNMTPSADVSRKGLKAGYYLDLTGGTLTVDAYDNAISSKGAIHVFGGEIRAASGSDAFHTEGDFYMIFGSVTAVDCEEAIEGATVTLDGGKLTAVTRDDCVNATGYTDKTNTLAPGTYSGNTDADDGFGGASLNINGGTYVLDPTGDGFDSNGSITISGGTITMSGPSKAEEGAFDYLKTFSINGGEFICVTGDQHVNKPTDAAQAYLMVKGLNGAAGDTVTVTDASGKELLKIETKNVYQAVYAAAPSFAAGSSYHVLVNGTEAGSAAAEK